MLADNVFSLAVKRLEALSSCIMMGPGLSLRAHFAAAAVNRGNHANFSFSPAYDIKKAVLGPLFHILAPYLNRHLGRVLGEA
ncbi:MAG: hypothetical protein ACJAZ5_002125 [Alloalcanivorax venustensis]